MVVRTLEHKNITESVVQYLHNSNISIAQTASDLGISEDKLRICNDTRLDASEFLALCQYLNMRPEDFMMNG